MNPGLKAISHLFLSEVQAPDFPPSPPSREPAFDPEQLFKTDLFFPARGQWEQILQGDRLCRALIAGLRVYLQSATGPTDPRLEILQRMADNLEGARQGVDLQAAIQKAAERMAERFAERRTRYIETLPERLPSVRGIPALLGEMVEHLLRNSLEALAEAAKDAEVRLSAQYTSQDVFLTVGDNGEGLSTKTLNRMFFPFFTTRQGAGLGLFWVCRILELHHGRLKLWSRAGVGTEFYLRLPIDG